MTKKPAEKKFTMNDLIIYVIIGILGGNVSGGIAFSKGPDSDTLKRIEQKVDQALRENQRLKESVQELKIQVREIKLIDKLKKTEKK